MNIWGNAITIDSTGDRHIIVPTAYTQLQYVEIDASGPYIDLGIVPTNHTVRTKVTVLQFEGNDSIFGTDADKNYFHMTEYSNAWYWGRNGNETNSGSTVNVSKGNIYDIEYNSGPAYEVIVNGFVVGSGTQITAPSGNNLYIAKRASRRGSYVRYYYFYVTDKSTGVAVRYLTPAKRKYDNAVGFWDSSEFEFLTNDGTGSFIAGPDA